MRHAPEMLMLQHRFTEQIICVDRDDYLAGAHGRYCNWQMKGQGRFIAPPPLLDDNARAITRDVPARAITRDECKSGDATIATTTEAIESANPVAAGAIPAATHQAG